MVFVSVVCAYGDANVPDNDGMGESERRLRWFFCSIASSCHFFTKKTGSPKTSPMIEIYYRFAEERKGMEDGRLTKKK